MKIFIIGGWVRDSLLGLKPNDLDFVVVGATEDDLIERGYKKLGACPVFLDPEGNEYALARTEIKIGPKHTDFSFCWNPEITLEQDLVRRDITINAIAADLEGNITDPYGGLKDLDKKIIRHISPKFVEDSLRIFRVARFMAKLTDFNLCEDTRRLMKDMVVDIKHLSKERIWKEISKGLVEKDPLRMLNLLQSLEIFDKIGLTCSSFNTLEKAAANSDDRTVRIACFLYDLNGLISPFTKVIPKKYWKFYKLMISQIDENKILKHWGEKTYYQYKTVKAFL